MKVGDYVRTKHWGIFKILKIINQRGKMWFLKEPGHQVFISSKEYPIEEEVIKSSPNIIDLITDDDLLEVEYPISSGVQKEVLQVINSAGGLYVNSFIRKVKLEDFNIYNFNILGIITKEQFESMEYRIGE